MEIKKVSNIQLAKKARSLGKTKFMGNTHDKCGTNIFYSHNRQCVHCREERRKANPLARTKYNRSKIVTDEARDLYLSGKPISYVVKTLNIDEISLRDSLRNEGVLRSRGKRKGHINKVKPTKKERENNLFKTASNIFNINLKSREQL